jgi:hypothetical protein
MKRYCHFRDSIIQQISDKTFSLQNCGKNVFSAKEHQEKIANFSAEFPQNSFNPVFIGLYS